MSVVISWCSPSEETAEAHGLKVCAERRQQWGDDDECDHDGRCVECQQDIAEFFETPDSKRRRGVAT